MRYLKAGRLFCFSPPIMLATFVIEICLAVYVVWRFKLTPVSRLAVAMLVGLAVFQLAEYNVCEGAFGMDSLTWARVGYVAITLLPPLGIHLAVRLAEQRRPLLLSAAYGSAVLFVLFFLFVGHGMQGQACLGNYVIFTVASWAVPLYGLYYYGWLFCTVAYALRAAGGIKAASRRRALYILAVGYMAFIIPTTLANAIDPTTMAGIPSIMCGFAVILAVALAIGVLPQYVKKVPVKLRRSAKTKKKVN